MVECILQALKNHEIHSSFKVQFTHTSLDFSSEVVLATLLMHIILSLQPIRVQSQWYLSQKVKWYLSQLFKVHDNGLGESSGGGLAKGGRGANDVEAKGTKLGF